MGELRPAYAGLGECPVKMKCILIISLCLLCWSTPLLAADTLDFIPRDADAVITLNPSRLLNLANSPDPEASKRFEQILGEMAIKTGVHLVKDVELAGIYLLVLDEFLQGSRPRAVLFARGKIQTSKVIKTAGVEVSKVDEFEVYPVGAGVVFAFPDPQTVLFGSLNDVLAGLMAAKKPSLSSRKLHQSVERIAGAGQGVFAVSVQSGEAVRKNLAALLPEGINPEVTVDILRALQIQYDQATGLEIELTTASTESAARLQPLLGKTLEAGAGKVSEEIERYRKNEGDLADEANVRTLKGMELSHALLSGMTSTASGDKVKLAVAGEKIKALTDALFMLALRIINRNYGVARGEGGVRRCLANMKIMEGAAELSVLDGKAAARTAVSPELLVTWNYIRQQPVCPQGGQYSLVPLENSFGVKCTAHGEMNEIYDKLYDPAKTK